MKKLVEEEKKGDAILFGGGGVILLISLAKQLKAGGDNAGKQSEAHKVFLSL